MAQEAGLQKAGGPAADARGPPAMLAPFIRYLEEAGLMRLRVTGEGAAGEADREAADNAIRLQAFVMLGNRLGLGAPYECDGYAFGPVSSALAGDAQALEGDRARLYDGVPAAVPGTFRRGEFERLVAGKDTDWLAAASKMARLRAYRSTRERLIDTVSDDDLPGEPAYTREYASAILGELERAGLAEAYP